MLFTQIARHFVTDAFRYWNGRNTLMESFHPSFPRPFFSLRHPCGFLCTALRLQTARMGRRLPVGTACQRASAKSSCRAGRPASTTLSARGQLEEGCCKGALRSNSQDAAPSHDPSRPGSSPERGRHFCCTRAGQQTDEGGCFGRPYASK